MSPILQAGTTTFSLDLGRVISTDADLTLEEVKAWLAEYPEPVTELEPALGSHFPSSDMELTPILVVRDVVESPDWYQGVLGA